MSRLEERNNERNSGFSLGYNIGAGWEEAASFLFFISLSLFLVITPFDKASCMEGGPSSFLAESRAGGPAVTWPPSLGGGNPGGCIQMCVCSEASEMTAEPRGFQSSCDSG